MIAHISGQGAASKGPLGHEWPLRKSDSPSGQKTPTGNENQKAHAESEMERDVLFRGLSDTKAAVKSAAPSRFRLWSVFEGRFHWGSVPAFVPGECGSG